MGIRNLRRGSLDKLTELSKGEKQLINAGVLRKELGWDEDKERFKRIKQELISEKVIVSVIGGPGGLIGLAGPRAADVPGPLSVFISYSHADEDLKIELTKHLTPLRRLKLIDDWHDRKIQAGEKFDSVISEKLETADIIILMISIDFINSEYCYNIEMETALDRAEKGQAVVIPVIARNCLWKNTPFSSYLALPTDGKAISGWHDRDEALAVVAAGVQKTAEQLISKREDEI